MTQVKSYLLWQGRPVSLQFPYLQALFQQRPRHRMDEFEFRHPPMEREKRAKIFAPYDALDGYSASVKKKNIEYVEKVYLDESQRTELNRRLVILHGLTRTLLNNMVVGVTEGYKKELDVNGVGYRVAKEGKKLTMNIGYSHPVVMEEIDGITIDVPSPNKIIINGIDKQKVGQFAAEVRGKRPPEPYKGKGIKYTDEVIRRKEGKTGVKK